MVLGIAEDFSSSVTLDAQLTAVPDSGVYLNTGVHPSITIDNLLSFLPIETIVPATWVYTSTYGVYTSTRNKTALVSYASGGQTKIYQSIKAGNLNKPPVANPDYWIETNIESLRLKSFIDKVTDKVLADLNLTKRLVNNQFLYEVGKSTMTLPANYCGFVFEPKGSDYTTFKINQIAIQKMGTTPLNLYVVNQGVLVDTLVLTPKNGRVEFDDLNYTFTGIGPWYFVIDSTVVLSNGGYIDPLKYDGMLVYACSGIGGSPETADYARGTSGMGLGFNISVYLDSALYVKNNLDQFASYVRAAFEYLTFQMFLSNSNNRSNVEQRIQMDKDLLIAELKDLRADSVAYRYHKQLEKARVQLERSFDSQLSNENGGIDIELTSN